MLLLAATGIDPTSVQQYTIGAGTVAVVGSVTLWRLFLKGKIRTEQSILDLVEVYKTQLTQKDTELKAKDQVIDLERERSAKLQQSVDTLLELSNTGNEVGKIANKLLAEIKSAQAGELGSAHRGGP